MIEFQKIFAEIIKIADLNRPGYKNSLGKEFDREHIKNTIAPVLRNLIDMPDIYYEIYELVGGTPRDIKDQALMDFIPGYRLINLK